jgi:RHS repeat-associated protein
LGMTCYGAVYLGSRPLALEGNASCGNTARFLHPNVIASTTMETEYNGAVADDVLFYPWGQLWTDAGLMDYQFAGTIWMESGAPIDTATFRLYNFNQGRSMTPDPLGGDITNPQSLNRYAYVLNNPETLVDPLGLDPNCDERDKGWCEWINQINGISSQVGFGSPQWQSPGGLVGVPVTGRQLQVAPAFPGAPGNTLTMYGENDGQFFLDMSAALAIAPLPTVTIPAVVGNALSFFGGWGGNSSPASLPCGFVQAEQGRSGSRFLCKVRSVLRMPMEPSAAGHGRDLLLTATMYNLRYTEKPSPPGICKNDSADRQAGTAAPLIP